MMYTDNKIISGGYLIIHLRYNAGEQLSSLPSPAPPRVRILQNDERDLPTPVTRPNLTIHGHGRTSHPTPAQAARLAARVPPQLRTARVVSHRWWAAPVLIC